LAAARDSHVVRARVSGPRALPDADRALAARLDAVHGPRADAGRPGARPRDLCEGEAGLSPEHPGRGGARPEAEGADRIRSVVRLVTHELQDNGEPEQHPKAGREQET